MLKTGLIGNLAVLSEMFDLTEAVTDKLGSKNYSVTPCHLYSLLLALKSHEVQIVLIVKTARLQLHV